MRELCAKKALLEGCERPLLLKSPPDCSDHSLDLIPGGSATGNGYITSTQENIQVVQEVLGNSAPQPPAPGTGLFGPGCVVGNQTFK